MARPVVVGATSWGTTLAVLLARKGLPVNLLVRSAADADLLDAERENKRFLPGIPFPPALTITADPAEALHHADVIFLAVPSQTMRANVRALAGALPPNAILVSLAKGLELQTGLRMSQVIADEVGPAASHHISVLSGPNLAREIALELPSATVIACGDTDAARQVQDLVVNRWFRAYVSDDVVGVELGGTLKNIVALGAGMTDGWGYGDNAKAAYMTRGLTEITRFGVACGADPLTFLGLAGFGDLVATCMSPLSRNRRTGEGLAKGLPLPDVLAGLGGTAEGIPTTKAAHLLAESLGIDMPITSALYRVLFEGQDPQAAVAELLNREPHREFLGLRH